MAKIDPRILAKTVKAITPKEDKPPETQIRGTIVFRDGEHFVRIDGAPNNALTPISDTAEGASDAGFVNGDRVLVLLKNHQAIVTKNLTTGLQAQAAKEAGAFVTEITDEGITAQRIIANDIFTNTLRANEITADEIIAGMATIDTLDANYAHITEGVIDNAKIGVADVEDLEANYAHITQGVIDNAKIDQADVNNLSANYAQINAANISDLSAQNAWVNKLLVQTGLIAHEGSIFTLDAIQVNAANITAGTISVDRLIVTVDGQKYLVDIDPSTGAPSYEKLDGNIVEPRTITADRIVAHDITVQEITTENLVGTNGWINLNQGTFFFTANGSTWANATQGIMWDGTSLKIKGDVNITAGNVYTKTQTDSALSGKVGNNEVITKINASSEGVKIEASKVEIDGTAIFNNSDFQTALDAEDFATSSDLPTKVSDLTNDSGYQTASDVSSAVSSGVSGKADKTDAVARQQRIYYRKTASGEPAKNTTWLSTSGTGYGNWSLKIPPLTNGSTKYPYLYTAVQTQTVSQQAAGSTCSCSDVLLDDSTTVIDGGNIITGSVTANQIAANSITANKIRIGDFNNYVTSTENDALSLISGQIAVEDGVAWVYKNVASNSNLWISPVLNNWTKEGEKYRVTGFVKTPSAGKVQVIIFGRLDNASYSSQSAVSTEWVITAANTETEINSVITISSGVAAQPKSNIAIQFQTTDGTAQAGYFRQLKVERMSGAELIVDGSITTDKLAANAVTADKIAAGALTIGDMDSTTTSQILNSEIKIGGRNLVRALDSSKITVNKLNCSYTYNNGTYILTCTTAGGGSNFTQIYSSTNATALLFNDVSPGDIVIFHVDSVVASNSATEPRIYLDIRKADGTYIVTKGIYEAANNWVNKFEIPEEAARYTLIIRMDQNKNSVVNDTLTVSGIKLEKGNTVTDWTPAPEDVDDSASAVSNMLRDWNAPTLTAVNATTVRYWAGSNSIFTYDWTSITNPPETSITYGARVTLATAQTADVQTGIAFYADTGNKDLPMYNGNSYTISCWARVTSGSGRLRIYYRNNGALVGAAPMVTLSSVWTRVYGVATPTNVDYGRVWFYVNFATGTTGTVELCGFKCVANGDSAEATKYITAINDDGIRVHAANNPTSNYASIDATGMDVYKGGVSVAKYGDTSRIGKIAASNGNIRTNSTGMDLYVNTTKVGSFHQQTGYTPEDRADTYNNALFIDAAEYFAVRSGSTLKPMIETNGTEVDINFGGSSLITADDFNAAEGGGPVTFELWGHDSSEITDPDPDVDFSTFINVYGGIDDGDGGVTGVGLGVGDDGNQHGVWSAMKERWLIGAANSGEVMCPGVYLNTTSGGSNVRILGTNASSFDYMMKRYASSSRRYKTEIDDISDDALDPSRLYDARVVQFKYKDGYLGEDDQRNGKLVNGFIAEELDDIYPIAVQYENGLPEDWEPKFLIPPMLKLIQDQKKKIDELEARIEKLEKRF